MFAPFFALFQEDALQSNKRRAKIKVLYYLVDPTQQKRDILRLPFCKGQVL
jgi:hypothetical protein